MAVTDRALDSVGERIADGNYRPTLAQCAALSRHYSDELDRRGWTTETAALPKLELTIIPPERIPAVVSEASSERDTKTSGSAPLPPFIRGRDGGK